MSMLLLVLVAAGAAAAGFLFYRRRRAARALAPPAAPPAVKPAPVAGGLKPRAARPAAKESVPKLTFVPADGRSRPPRCRQARPRNDDPLPSPHPWLGRMRRDLELRKLDVVVAKDLYLFDEIVWSETSGDQPSGIPKTRFGKGPLDPRERQVIPRYSSEETAFVKVVERLEGFSLYEVYVGVLKEGAKGEDAALEVRCRAALEAMNRKRQRPS